jgi:hypothetical protein
MGNLFLINDSFELKELTPERRDFIFRNFCYAIDKAKAHKDNLHANNDFFTHSYSFGDIYKLFLSSWEDINSNSNLRGISNTTLQLFPNLIYAIPGLVKSFISMKEFNERFSTNHFGYSGFEFNCDFLPYVKCNESWHLWKIQWYREHPETIDWNKKDTFLANKEYSNEILKKEIEKHGKGDLLKGNNLTTIFYDEVMKHKGPELEAYTNEIGRRIAEANYYTFEPFLSSSEQKRKRSFRKIFSLIAGNGSKQYISLDFEKGMFEYHNYRGEHLGEYRFDGIKSKDSESSHNLATLSE